MTILDPGAYQYIPTMTGDTFVGESITETPVFNQEVDDRSGFNKVLDFYRNYWGAVKDAITGDRHGALAQAQALIQGEPPPPPDVVTITEDTQNKVSYGLLGVLVVLAGGIWFMRKKKGG